MLQDMKKLQEHYELHQSLPWVPCYVYGHPRERSLAYFLSFLLLPVVTIEVKMAEAIWKMGLLIRCGKEVMCPL